MTTLHQFYESQALHMEDIYTAFRKSGIAFTKSQAIKIVGGRTRLERLVMQKKIRVNIPSGSYRCGQWQCNGEDVLRHASVKYSTR